MIAQQGAGAVSWPLWGRIMRQWLREYGRALAPYRWAILIGLIGAALIWTALIGIAVQCVQ